MKQAIADGEMYQSSMIAVTPISLARKEVSINSTRIGNLDATQTSQLSRALPDLLEQVWMGVNFMRKYVPGFENAVFSGIAPRIGIRETRRVMGEYVLTKEDVMQARKREDGIGKGAHELDVHGSGVKHVRSTIKDEGSYDIPYDCLVPRNVKNMFVAGRCFSSTRDAHSSARVMGTCMAMGQAAGTAAAWCAASPTWKGDVREVDVQALAQDAARAGRGARRNVLNRGKPADSAGQRPRHHFRHVGRQSRRGRDALHRRLHEPAPRLRKALPQVEGARHGRGDLRIGGVERRSPGRPRTRSRCRRRR